MRPHEEEWAIDNVMTTMPGTVAEIEARDVLATAAPNMARALVAMLASNGHMTMCHAWFGGGGACIEPCRGVRAALTKAGVIP